MHVNYLIPLLAIAYVVYIYYSFAIKKFKTTDLVDDYQIQEPTRAIMLSEMPRLVSKSHFIRHYRKVAERKKD